MLSLFLSLSGISKGNSLLLILFNVFLLPCLYVSFFFTCVYNSEKIFLNKIRCLNLKHYLWGQKVLKASVHSISSPRPTPRRKKCPRTNEGNLDCQIVLPRTTLSSAGQNHRRERRHAAQGNPLEDHKRDSKPYGLVIGAWWRSNPRRSCHLRIKYPQLTP